LPERRRVAESQLDDLVALVGAGLLDPCAEPRSCALVPDDVPSGRPTLTFEFP
jgi:hypothetical protein